MRNTSDKDESRGWVLVAELVVVLALVIGIRLSFGVFFKPLEDAFNLSRAATSSVFSVYMALSCGVALLGGWSLDRYGPRKVLLVMGVFVALSLVLTSRATAFWQLFLTYSLLLSLGTGPGFTLVLATVSKWFTRRRGLALGFALSGEGLGTLTVAPFAAWLISAFDWRDALVVVGLIAGAVIIFISLILRRKPENGSSDANLPETISKSVHDNSFTLSEASRTRSFWFIIIIYLLFSSTFHLVLTHIVPHATDIGIDAALAAVIIALAGGSTIPGRLVLGWFSDRLEKKRLAIGCALLQVLAMGWLTLSGSLWMFYLFAVVFGFAFGGLSNLMASLIGDIYGLANLGTITGALVIGFSAGGALGPLIGGFVYDSTGSYYYSFLLGVVAMITAALLLTLVRHEKRQLPATAG